MSTDAPPLEIGEASVLRSVEQKKNDDGGGGGSLNKPSIYEALSDSGHGASKPKSKPSFVRLVRKVMAEKNLLGKESSKGHTRTGSNAKAYDMIKKMELKESEPKLHDVFEETIFYPHNSPDDSIISEEGEEEGENQEAQVDVESTPLIPQEQVRRLKQRKQGGLWCNGAAIKSFLWDILAHCWLLSFAALLAALALFLYYKLGNPSLDALPGRATLSWWCNFLARQIVTLEMARVLKYLIIDCLILGSSLSVRIAGPFMTLLSIQAKTWPFVFFVWGILDCCLIQGDNGFQNHWLRFTGWEIYSIHSNSGLYIIASERYLRILVCLIVAGAATALKRTFLAISFGRRQYATFKPRLEKLLLDVVLLNEIASLSADADIMFEEMKTHKETKKGKRATLGDVSWDSVKLNETEESEEDVDTLSGTRGYSRSSSRGPLFKQLLDRWQEPVKRSDKNDVTIEDVLRFRRALAFMDEMYPFGEHFGLASTRDEAITSAELVYQKLCKISTEDHLLPFETLALIALEEDDSFDEVKNSALRRVFHPDADNMLTLFAFVQSCDSLYRRLRFFLATVENSASLDNVLENVVNCLYYFVLALFLMSLMNYNAWSLLLSMTSLLVSFSFAFGQTVSKYVQGIILIAITRPFDLGDRIFLTPASDVERNFENVATSYFVEDITLSTTKLRYARTGEIAYLSNYLLADMRIYNCNRSPNASVVILQMLHISILDRDNLAQFEKALRRFVDERPRMWVEVLMIVVYKIDPDNEQVFLQLAFRHREAWQSFARITINRAELIRFIHDTSKTLKVAFETPAPRRVLYYGGNLDHGTVVGEEEHRKDLLRPQNVRSRSFSSTQEHASTASTGTPLPPPLNTMEGI